jgi:hypothetical protein
MVLATQTPRTRVLPAPHPYATSAVTPSGCGRGASGTACADDVKASTKATAINLIIASLRSAKPTPSTSRLDFSISKLQFGHGRLVPPLVIGTGRLRHS